MQITQPRVARNELPWVSHTKTNLTLKGFYQPGSRLAALTRCALIDIKNRSRSFVKTPHSLCLCSAILQDHSFSRRVFVRAQIRARGAFRSHLIFTGSSFPVAFCRSVFIC